MPQTVTNWGLAAWTATAAALANLLGWLPRLIGAVVVLLVGWGLAVLLGNLADRALEALHFDRLMERAGVDRAIARSGMRLEPSDLVGALVKWGVFLLAILVASDALGLPQVTAALNAVLGYIPDVIAAILILTFGAVLASFVGNVVKAAPMAHSQLMGQIAYWAVVVFAALAALTQLNIAPGLILTLFSAVVGAVALAAAIAFGLGLRHQAEDLVVGATLRQMCHVGDVLTLPDVAGERVTGTVEAIGAGMIELRTERGTLMVPNRMVAEHVATRQGAARVHVTRLPETPGVASTETPQGPPTA